MKTIRILLLLCTMTGLANANEPIMRVTMDKAYAIPGTPVILTITILSPTWLPKAPEIPNIEIPNLMVRVPPNSSSSAGERINGQPYAGLRREFYMYPMIVAEFEIPQIPITITYADPTTFKPVTAIQYTDPIKFQGVLPAAAKDIRPFIAAESLELVQSIDGDPDSMKSGDAITRTITATITGSPPLFIPELTPRWQTAGIGAYPKEPELTETNNNGVPGGSRKEQVTYIPQYGGSYSVPAVSIQWFNLTTNEIETAEVPGLMLTATGSPPTRAEPVNWQELIFGASAILAVLYLTFKILGALTPAIKARQLRRKQEYLASERFAFQQLEAAINEKNLDQALCSLDEWRRRISLGHHHLAAVSDALLKIGPSLYGRNRQQPPANLWADAALASRGARKLYRQEQKAQCTETTLPPINPRLARGESRHE